MIHLPGTPATREPYAFTGSYAGCFEIPEVAMDRRHIFLLMDILLAWPFVSALEIGSYNGASATAFIEAINAGEGLGQGGVATFCDVKVRDSLVDVVRSCRSSTRVRITPQRSWQVLDSELPFDFIFVDGAHDVDSVSQELKRLMVRRPLCVMAHDTHSTAAGYGQCEGAELLKQTFERDGEYYCIEDCRKREGERTERGLFFATLDPQLYHRAKRIYEKWT